MTNTLYGSKRWTDRFIRTRPDSPSEEERVRRVIRLIPPDVKTILDVGTGGGYIYRALKAERGRSCFGLDISFDLVRRLGDGAAVVADTVRIPFKDAAFDLVLAADLIEHIQHAFFHESVSEVIRVSKKYILINSPYKDAVDWPVSQCARCRKEFNIYGHVRSVDMGLIRDLFPERGFEVLASAVFGGKRDVRPLPLVRFARKRGKVYSAEGAVCPFCSSDSIMIPTRTFGERICAAAACGLFRIMDRAIPAVFKNGAEMCVLVRKR